MTGQNVTDTTISHDAEPPTDFPGAAADRRRSERSARPQWGMVSFLVSEVAFFSTLIVAYVTFLGKDVVGPTPAEALSLPLVIGTTICLLSSSVVDPPGRASARARATARRSACWWAATIALGIAFLLGTAYRMARA